MQRKCSTKNVFHPAKHKSDGPKFIAQLEKQIHANMGIPPNMFNATIECDIHRKRGKERT